VRTQDRARTRSCDSHGLDELAVFRTECRKRAFVYRRVAFALTEEFPGYSERLFVRQRELTGTRQDLVPSDLVCEVIDR
jgi:hypothetical protein